MSEASLCLASASGAAARRALLVGINDYPRQPLRGCLNDVAAVRDFLVEQRGFALGDIAVLTDAQATRAAILAELHRQAARSQSGDSLVFYFCGHGAQLPSRDLREADGLDEVLCPVDFAWTAETAIVDDELERLFDSVPAGVELIWVFDACHTGEIDEQLDARVAAFRGLAAPAALAPRAAAAAASPGGRSVRRTRAHGVILSACAATEKAADIMVDGRAHGAFTHHLLAAARRAPQASAAELLAAAREQLAKIGQHPEGYGPGLAAPLLLAPRFAAGSVDLSLDLDLNDELDHGGEGVDHGVDHGSDSVDHRSTMESNVKHRAQRTVFLPAKPSVDADRHLHMYLAEASRLAKTDDLFGTRMSQLGLDLSGISVSDASALARAVKPAPRSGGMVCRTFWWGFHLEIPHAEVEALAAAGISHEALSSRIEMAPHRVVPHLATLTSFVVGSFENIKRIDRGAGVFVSMSSFAPDLYVTTAVPVRAPTVRRPTDSDKIRAIGM